MKEDTARTRRLRIRALGLAAAAAFVGVGSLSLVQSADGTVANTVAGSGDAPANTEYVKPTDGAMTMGATATWTTPASIEESPKAVPPIKAGG